MVDIYTLFLIQTKEIKHDKLRNKQRSRSTTTNHNIIHNKGSKRINQLRQRNKKKDEWIFRKSKWKLKKPYGTRNKNKRPLQKRTTRKHKHRSKRPQRLKKELNKLGVNFSVMKNKESKNYEIFLQAKDIKVMEYAFKQVIAKENKNKKKVS